MEDRAQEDQEAICDEGDAQGACDIEAICELGDE